MSSHDGGPAFPRATTIFEGSVGREVDPGQSGMGLRDWFAGQALAMLSDELKPAEVAEMAYWIADEMLKARTRARRR